MSDAQPDDTPHHPSAIRPAIGRNSPKPRDGRCQCCGKLTGRVLLVWDHCHDCGAGRGWCCDPCNTALTEHLIENWVQARAYLDGHDCGPSPGLFDLPPRVVTREQRSPHTKPLQLNNGAGDGRTVNVSRHRGLFTIEQVAVVLGVSTPTARDLFNGRRSQARTAFRKDDTYLIPWETLLTLIEERVQKGLT